MTALDPFDPASALHDLALDLRWTWSHEADALWQQVDAAAWECTRNPWVLLQDTGAARLRTLVAEPGFAGELRRLAHARSIYLDAPGWFAGAHGDMAFGGVAYFSMEFGLDEGLPLYAGGLGILAGDYLKTASDLGVPMVGIGLLYREGYFRQIIDAAGWQQESYPVNDPSSLPIRPARTASGAWLQIPLDLPGRSVRLRVWEAKVGRVTLYLLDANHPQNAPADRGVTSRLYEAGAEARLLQELVLGIAGWRVVEAMAPSIEICHLNEGHAAFVVIERARAFRRRTGMSFPAALWATRAGNLFTTHTPVEAGFDRFSPALIARYLEDLVAELAVPLGDLLALGRVDPAGPDEPFNMGYLALRGSGAAIGVSRQHGVVSRRLFQPLFPRWPEREVPVGHVTNGVHVPSWDSADADRLWTGACGKERWRCAPGALAAEIADLGDAALWTMRGAGRQALVAAARQRLTRQFGARGEAPAAIEAAGRVLDPNILTLGFARRFTAYKRPNLLLRDTARLVRLLTDATRPVQLIVAGKAHPADDEGKQMIREWFRLAGTRELRHRLVFLEDYDLALAQELVQGVDVWINTPRRPWEACGTSGMKVLVNGGLNLSVLDGWWEEAYAPELGWAVGDDAALTPAARDVRDAEQLYDRLEDEIVPEFYERDETGLPARWLERIRASLSRLTPAFSSNRMLHEHVERLYLPAAAEYRRRSAANGAAATALHDWEQRLRRSWPRLHIGAVVREAAESTWHISVPVYLDEIAPEEIRVEIYAEPRVGEPPFQVAMDRGAAIPGERNGHIFAVGVADARPAEDYTVRIVPCRSGVRIPTELPLILWQR